MELAARQHGVVTVEQAVGLGLSRSTFQRLAQREGWRRIHRGVYLLPGVERTVLQDCQAALLAAGPDSVLCRRTAGSLHGLLPVPPVVELFLPDTERAPVLRGVRVARTRTLLPSDLTVVQGLTVTHAARTAVDLAAVIEPPDLRAYLIGGRQRRLVNLEWVERRAREIGRVRGVGVVKRLAWELHPEHCDSVLEAICRELIRQAGLAVPHAAPYAVRVGGGRVLHIDIAWPEHRVGVEVDGLSYHAGHREMDRDHRRSNALVLAGWRILHVGWHRLERDPEGFLAELRALLS